MIILSERAQNKLDKPQFYTEMREFEEFKSFPRPGQFTYTFQHKKIGHDVVFFGLVDLTTIEHKIIGLKYTTDLTGAKRVFLEGAVELLQGKKLLDITALSVREVEYYLRDRNDQSAFSEAPSIFYPLLEFLPLLQNEIQKSTGQKRNGEKKVSPVIGEDYIPGEKTVFVKSDEKNFLDLDRSTQFSLAQEVMTKYINPALRIDHGSAELVYVDYNMMVIVYYGACISCGYSLTNTLDYIQKVFQMELCEPKIRVMTDN